jgi:alkanesulfonate monooxygenase SsuD/methylene tetrahydromethanopterin reductase-like flavin-dependent oxidoreductase (luciferase family)
LPQRQPLFLAKEAATIDILSAGRLALGLGVGWVREEFDALNVP